MSFTVVIPDKLQIQLTKLPKDLQVRILSKLTFTQVDPFRFFGRMKGRLEYKLRVGDYRIIADIDGLRKIITIVKVGHRKNIYQD